ncbi:MAG: GntR family transcriptional regulator [Melioribacteraceae bacterium]|nr:GntR family transcriptional regulator [Melioribacteraceae bacterium]
MSKVQKSKKYNILIDEILSYIKKNNLKRGDKLPTVLEIIDKWSFSYSTVNRTLLELEKHGIIDKQKGKGLFVKNTEIPKQVKQVALVIPDSYTENKIFMNLLNGVRNELENAGIGMLVSITDLNHQKEKETIEMLISKNVDGLIIFMESNYRNDYNHITDLKDKDFPFILIDRYIPELETDYVIVNNKDIMVRICSYLKYNRNCDSIFYVIAGDDPKGVTSTEEKLEGFAIANKLLFGKDDKMVISLNELVSNYSELLKSYDNIGLCFNYDELVTEFLNILSEQGKEMPENIHLFGYNNVYDEPAFPSVEQFNTEVGRKAAEILINKINNIENKEIIKYRIEPKLVIPNNKGGFHLEA